MIDRLTLSAKGIEAMAVGLEQVAALPDPVGEMGRLKRRPSGHHRRQDARAAGRHRHHLRGRPNVTADAAALCLKSGNAGDPARRQGGPHSNQAIAACVPAGLAAAGLPGDWRSRSSRPPTAPPSAN